MQRFKNQYRTHFRHRYGDLEWWRENNALILYAVGDRTEDTHLPIIKRHDEVESTEYSDGWSL